MPNGRQCQHGITSSQVGTLSDTKRSSVGENSKSTSHVSVCAFPELARLKPAQTRASSSRHDKLAPVIGFDFLGMWALAMPRDRYP